MALPEVDMDSCCKKKRCLNGGNVGKLYDTCKPCPDNSYFDRDSCDCVPDRPTGYYAVGIIPNFAFSESVGPVDPPTAYGPHLIDTEEGGFIAINSRRENICSAMDENLPIGGRGEEWFEGEAIAGYKTEGKEDGCNSKICCTPSGNSFFCPFADVYPLYRIWFSGRLSEDGEPIPGFQYFPYLAGVSCTDFPSNTKRKVQVTILYGETYEECSEAMAAFLTSYDPS